VTACPRCCPTAARGAWEGPPYARSPWPAWRVVDALPHVDVVGVGGVATPTDVRAFLAAGARAVGVGTALLHDPTTAARLAAALREETR
jgi:dihydroorotate dehydrogenase (NAD+) catalytic subunit